MNVMLPIFRHPRPLRACQRALVLLMALIVGLGACKTRESGAPAVTVDASAPVASAPQEQAPAQTEKKPEAPADGTVSPSDEGPAAPAVFFLAGLKGYTEPCGCTADILMGGIDRITGYVEAARKLYPAVAMIDAGDLFFETAVLEEHLIAQERAKLDVVLAAHRKLGTLFTVPGENDFAMGADFYLEKLRETGLPPLVANATINGEKFDGTRIVELDGQKVAFIGAIQPSLFKDIAAVKATEPLEAVQKAVADSRRQGARATILVLHGDLAQAKNLLEQVEGLDFAVVGHKPRETDQVDPAGNGHTLEAYDQGRYLGVLKLYMAPETSGFVNARTGSKAEIENIEEQIAYVRQSLGQLPATPAGEPVPPIVNRLKEREAELVARKAEIAAATLGVPTDRRAFLFRPVGMAPGYPINAEIQGLRQGFNRSLRELNAGIEREVVAPAPGEAFYIGTDQCAQCHGEAHDFWKGTAHAHAMATLQTRDKDFDQNCVGCHVVGWEKPGGSVLGKLQYPAQVAGQPFEKDLRNVGCESCHGPGSKHREAPMGADGKAQHILRHPTVDACQQCHVPEHSPRFDFDTYVRRVTGPGHELRASP